MVACLAADSFPFSGGAEIEQANEKWASEGARLGWAKKFGSFPQAFGKGKETAATQAKTMALRVTHRRIVKCFSKFNLGVNFVKQQ